MKIILKIDPETLFILQKLTMDQCQALTNNIAARSCKSMKVELFTILCQRCISYTSNPNGKKQALTLKYHLAALLYDIITDMRYSMGIYEGNKIEMLKNDLHQKLQ